MDEEDKNLFKRCYDEISFYSSEEESNDNNN